MADDVTFGMWPVDAPESRALLAAYLGELEHRLHDGPAAVQWAPDPEDFLPPHGAFVVAWRGDEPVGCGAVRRITAGIAELKRMYVAPSARGTGAGRRLLDELERLAAELGPRTVRLDTAGELHEARRLYERAGYRAIPDYNGNPHAAHWYEKQLLVADV